MKKEFSKAWKGSKQPRKQRKYLAKAPIHLKRKLLSVNLSKDLRTKHNTRNIELVKNDKVKIMRGKFKGKEGKITEIITKQLKVYVEGIQRLKQDGSKVNVPIRPSNLQIVELNLSDKKRLKRKTETPKKQEKSVIKETESKKEKSEDKKQ